MKFRIGMPKIRTQRQALVWVLGITLFIGCVMYLTQNGVERRAADENNVVLDVLPVQVGPSHIIIHANGVAQPASEIPLIAEVSGRVLEVNAEFVSGATVDPEMVLARIDAEPYELALAQRRNEVSGASLPCIRAI